MHKEHGLIKTGSDEAIILVPCDLHTRISLDKPVHFGRNWFILLIGLNKLSRP